ncbi:hypothetical protein [Sphingomonas sp. BAUL-RG-20F-R05-02]|uniref:hypothetical protein n=1 Tax=Sphingomonas sp. BAUL-RG-20F-R05-02 TaxID=2914830 RepID=UPI001F5AADF4|nr:hypothetical protein [Sphingomonas sp. BAUL-RG-20F-R05-02]
MDASSGEHKLRRGTQPCAPEPRETARQRAQRESYAIEREAIELRLTSFRAYLQATVVTMSPLAGLVLEAADFEVGQALQSLRPSKNWLSAPDTDRRFFHTRHAPTALGTHSEHACSREPWSENPADPTGEALLQDGSVGDFVMLVVLGSSVEIHLHGQGFQLATRAGTAYLALPQPLPDTVALYCEGLDLDAVVDHPILRGRKYVIADVLQMAGRSIILFDVGELPVVMPWPDDVATAPLIGNADHPASGLQPGCGEPGNHRRRLSSFTNENIDE